MVVRGTNKQNEPKEKRCNISLRSKQAEGALKINVPKSTESEWWFQECIETTTCSGEDVSTDYYKTLAWMWDTQDLICPPNYHENI